MEVKEAKAKYLVQQEEHCPRGYQRTEVGVIPEDWKLQPIGEITTVVDSLHKTPRFSEHGYSMVRVADIKTGNLDLRDTMNVSEEVFKEFTRNYRPRRGDIVLSRVGSYGVSSFIETDEPFCMGQNTVVIQSKLPSKYLYYVLNDRIIQQQIENGSYGSGYKSLSLKNIKELLVPTPHTESEQQAIAKALSDADELVESIKQLIAKKHHINKGVRQDLLRPKVGWVTKTLGEIAQIKTGNRNNQDKVIDGEYPFFVRSPTVERINSYSYDCEAILIPGEGGIGNIFHYITGRFDVHQRVYAITQFLPDVHGKYVYLYMAMNFGAHAMQNSVKATVDSLRLPTFQNFAIAMPATVEDQRSIANVVSKLDDEIIALEIQLKKTRQLKQGMMYELLTGRKRLGNLVGKKNA